MGALSEPLACVYQAVVELTEIKAGELVVVTRPGPIGLMALLLAKARGCWCSAPARMLYGSAVPKAWAPTPSSTWSSRTRPQSWPT